MCCDPILNLLFVISQMGLKAPGADEEIRQITERRNNSNRNNSNRNYANRNYANADNEYTRLIDSQSSSIPQNT